MVEPIMYFAIGFLVAALLGLGIVPLVHARAVRLTIKRLEAATPLSMAEIQADKDQLRAEFAMSARRLEISLEQLKAKAATQSADLGKKADAINRLKSELGEKNTAILTLEAHDKALKEQLRASEEEVADKTQGLREAERHLAERQVELSKLSGDLADRSVVAESRQVELVALQAQVDGLKHRVTEAETALEDARRRLADGRNEIERTGDELRNARERADGLGERVADLDRQLLVQKKEAEMLGTRAADLDNRLAAQGKLLAEREYENNLLRQQTALAQRTEVELRAAIAGLSETSNPALDKLRAEKTAIEQELQTAREERAKALAEAAAIRRQAEDAWASERMENAVLRERINDVAAEVAKLAVTLEGPNSTIAEIMNAAPVETAAATAHAEGKFNGDAGGTLASRIRTLQPYASRARQQPQT
jgi:chromosome segregation ATPase